MIEKAPEKHQGGKEVYIKAKKRSVIVCTGGYEFNLQMIRDYIHIQDFASPGSPYNTGDGISMYLVNLFPDYTMQVKSVIGSGRPV